MMLSAQHLLHDPRLKLPFCHLQEGCHRRVTTDKLCSQEIYYSKFILPKQRMQTTKGNDYTTLVTFWYVIPYFGI